MGVVELEAELEVLLDDILDRDRWLDDDATRLRVFGQQRRRIALDRLVGKVGGGFAHQSFILICILGNIAVRSGCHLSFARCA